MGIALISDTSGPALQVELANWLRSRATESVADNTFEQWVLHDMERSASDYCYVMERTHEWGGGIELKAFAHCKEIAVHVFECRGGEFPRISFARCPIPTEK